MIPYLQNDLWRFDFGVEESLERASSSTPLWPLWSFSLRGQKAEHLLYLVIPCYLWLVDHSWWFKVALLFLKRCVLESKVRNIGILLRFEIFTPLWFRNGFLAWTAFSFPCGFVEASKWILPFWVAILVFASWQWASWYSSVGLDLFPRILAAHLAPREIHPLS